LGDVIERLLHLDDPLRLRAYQDALTSPSGSAVDDSTRRLRVGLCFALAMDRLKSTSLEESLATLHAHPAIVEELRELLGLLDDISEHLTYPLDDELKWPYRVPLSVHARHTLDDALSTFGLLDVGKNLYKQTGVFRHEGTHTDIFFVTLEKSERDYSPSTRYKDYAISSVLFHWESQSGTTQASPTGQRYIQQRERQGNVLLFVRRRPDRRAVVRLERERIDAACVGLELRWTADLALRQSPPRPCPTTRFVCGPLSVVDCTKRPSAAEARISRHSNQLQESLFALSASAHRRGRRHEPQRLHPRGRFSALFSWASLSWRPAVCARLSSRFQTTTRKTVTRRPNVTIGHG
jgi:hypothetical protein